MEQVINSDQLDRLIENNVLVVIYFSGEKCNVCHALQPKVEELVKDHFPQIKTVEIPTDKAPELVGRFRMFSVPAVLFFVEQREYLREIRNISVPDLKHKIEKIVNLYSE